MTKSRRRPSRFRFSIAYCCERRTNGMGPGRTASRLPDVRHSYASRALALGEGLPAIGRLLGHVRVGTTAKYAHLVRDAEKAGRRPHRRQHRRLDHARPGRGGVRRTVMAMQQKTLSNRTVAALTADQARRKADPMHCHPSAELLYAPMPEHSSSGVDIALLVVEVQVEPVLDQRGGHGTEFKTLSPLPHCELNGQIFSRSTRPRHMLI